MASERIKEECRIQSGGNRRRKETRLVDKKDIITRNDIRGTGEIFGDGIVLGDVERGGNTELGGFDGLKLSDTIRPNGR